MTTALTALLTLAQATNMPARAGAPYDDFDFWLGEWDVFNEVGEPVGRNVITEEEQGCVILERWTAAGGGTGQSYNDVDPADGRWRQIWVSRPATIDYSGGLDAEGRMVLQGKIAYRMRPEETRGFRGTWTPREDGTVLRYFEGEAEDGSWKPWFTGIYRRADAEPAP